MKKPSKNAIRVARILIEAESMEWSISLEDAIRAVKFLLKLGLLE